jgi:hypothetical protein
MRKPENLPALLVFCRLMLILFKIALPLRCILLFLHQHLLIMSGESK